MSVETSDIETALGRTLTFVEQEQVAQWVGDALLIIRGRLGDPALLDQDTLDYVVREAVVSRMRNPEGFQSESIDDYTYRHGSETRRVTILDEWWSLLSPSSGTGAFTIRPYSDGTGLAYPDWWHDQ